MSIEPLLQQLLEPNQPNPTLRRALIEELNRRSKRKDIVLEYLGLEEVGTIQGEGIVLHVVSPNGHGDPWQEALLAHQGDCPIGFVCNSWDQGRIVMVHEVYHQLMEPQKKLVRTYAALAVRGMTHGSILTALSHGDTEAGHYQEIINEARRRMQCLDPSVLLSHDGEIRVQVGSLSQTTKDIMREGVKGNYLFILPKHLFEGRVNYADVEFMVYLNFFLRQGMRTRIAGMAGQKQVLEQLLSLTLFGLFSPQEPEPSSFTELHSTYGVPDQETYTFLRTCYEKYSVRQDFKPEGPILGIADYVDFVLLDQAGQPTIIPINKADGPPAQSHTGTVCVVPRPDGTFDVTLTQPDGITATKRLVVNPHTRMPKAVPDELRQAIQFATDRPRFGVTPLGTSHGFDAAGDNTSFVIWINGRGILVDPSPEALDYLDDFGVAESDLRYVFLTHVHADHDGGLLEKLLKGSRTTIIASDVVFRLFMEKARLITEHDLQQECMVEHVSANPEAPVLLEVSGEMVELQTRWNLHPIPTNGFILTVEGKRFGYAGDTQYDPDLIQQLHREKKLSQQQADNLLYFFWTPDGKPTVDLLYHEAGIPPIHTERRQLEHLSEAVKTKTFLVHIADHDVPPGSLPDKPPLFVAHTLLPPTRQSREGIILRTLGLVAYLYDIPPESLQRLVQMARLRVCERDEVIIRTGPVERGEDLSFFVITEGEVLIRSGRRRIIKLAKGESFGEWGISHQRGFRSADVVALRHTQLIELSEAAYRWMVTQHPVIQERLGRLRDLLPRLEFVRASARQKRLEVLPSKSSLIGDMTASQLAVFAVFSRVMVFDHGMPVVVEGDEADGFYILLSGHLAVTVGGSVVSEMSEGDVFGEVGLLEGGKRTATIEVISADAEVLFMSRQDFQTLLQTTPAFSFDIRVIAAQRHS